MAHHLLEFNLSKVFMFVVLNSLVAIIGAYLLGSVSFAVLVSRALRLPDPRTYGSQNPGATNVLRSGSKAAAILTLLLDAAKGWFPVYMVQATAAHMGWGELAIAAVALAAFLGHLWPVFFKFKGGKGVATAAGVLVGIHPLLGLMILGVLAAVAYAWRYSSLAALIAALAAPLCYLLGADQLWSFSAPMLVVCMAMSGLLIERHKDNIQRLMKGKESKLGSKAAKS
jgi:acyl phosphate:glycerol-3-phosphate acyltransferase